MTRTRRKVTVTDMPNSPAQALAVAEHLHKTDARYPGLCLKFVRTTLDIPAKYPSAKEAWRNIPATHRHGGIAPAGYPMHYNIGQFGHIVLSCGDGTVWSNISATGGQIERVPYASFDNYLGWSTQLNGVDLQKPPTKPSNPPSPAFKHTKWTRKLKRGMRGEDVRDLKTHLFGGKQGSYFGSKTRAKVIRIQKANPSLGTADGVVGPKTYQKITGHS